MHRNTPKKPYKVAGKKLFGLTKEALMSLEVMTEKSGETQTQVVNDLLAGSGRFSPPVEGMINEYMKTNRLGRKEAIESLIMEAIFLKHGKTPKR